MDSHYTRNGFVRRAGAAMAGLSAGVPLAAEAGTREPRPVTPDGALRRLLRGNERYARGKSTHPHLKGGYRHQLALGQHPFATIFGCVDSRVPPEALFDQGLGDLLVVRSAGEVLDDAVLASIEFGILELETPLLMVIGHEKCGAVAASIEAIESGEDPPGHLGYLVERIRPAVEQTSGRPGDHLDNAVRANARNVAAELRKDETVAQARAAGKLKVVTARYDLDTGRVKLLR